MLGFLHFIRQKVWIKNMACSLLSLELKFRRIKNKIGVAVVHYVIITPWFVHLYEEITHGL